MTRIDRRGFLRISALAGAALSTSGSLLAGCKGREKLVADPPGDRWMAQARIAGVDFSDFLEMDLDEALNAVVRTGASVIEGDSVLSEYLTDDQFERFAREIHDVSNAAHERNLKIVWYYPSLEVITAGGESLGVRSMFKDHPDWVQISLDRKPNVFYGGKEHWVDAGAESAWMCHASGYRDYFLARIRRLASTSLDGIWIDVPLFMDTVLRWCCFNPACIAKFRSDTGLSMEPLKEDWTDPVWRTWIVWRHEEMHRFLLDIRAEARSVNPRFEVIIETVPIDTDVATVQALDGSYRGFQLSKPFPGSIPVPEGMQRVDRVWEVDSVSNLHGMRPATHDDWICKLRAYKFAKGCDRGGPTWTFSYGSQEADAGLVMAIAVATGCAPYETKTPEMVTTVGEGFRTRMFQWIKAHKELLFDATPIATVGLVHSASSRDFIDRGPVDTAFFASAVYLATNKEILACDPSFFWGGSVLETQYSADFGGLLKALSHLHAPFSVVPIHGLADDEIPWLRSFRALVLPSLRCVRTRDRQALRDFVAQGGALLLTGPDVGWDDELGAPVQAAERLDALLGIAGATTPIVQPSGAGLVAWHPSRLGRDYFRTSDAGALAFVRDVLDRASARPVKMDDAAHPHVHVELAELGSRTIVHAVGYAGAPDRLIAGSARADGGYPFPNDYQVVRQDVTLDLDAIAGAKSVRFLSPDPQFREQDAQWVGGARVRFPVFQYTVVVVER